jgi:2-methylcitrate dehydratase PrpD
MDLDHDLSGVAHERAAHAPQAPRSTAALAKFVAETRYEDLPAAVAAATKCLILDEIVVTAAASETPMARALLRLKGDQGGSPEATLIVDGRKVPAASAAYVHGQLANLLDADETMHNRMHTVSASVMAGLAVAEKTGASGRDLLAAVAAGYDVTARVGVSLCQFVPDGKGGMVFAPLVGWSWMTLGAAATAGRLLGFGAPQIASALGQAFVTSPVYFDVLKNNLRLLDERRPASWHKYQMSGAMAEAGVNAALLTSYGWVAQEDVLDEGDDFWRSYAVPACDWDALYGGLGERWYVSECSIKPYPFCRFGHGALDVMTDIVRKHGLRGDDVEDILLRIAPHELSETLASTVTVDEGLKLMVSQPTALALIALGIPAGPRWFQADLRDEGVRRIARKVRYEVVPEWGQVLLEQTRDQGYFARLPTEVVVRTRAGAEHRGYTEYANGDPWSPEHAYDFARVGEKARQYLDGILPAAKIEALIAAVDGLDAAADVSAVVGAFVR